MAKKKKEVKAGDVVTLDEYMKKMLEDHQERYGETVEGLRKLINQHEHANQNWIRDFFDIVKGRHPELEGWHLRTGPNATVVVTRKADD